jgi:hypothetical protein
VLPEPLLPVNEEVDDAGLNRLAVPLRDRDRSCLLGVLDPDRRSSLTDDMCADDGTTDGYGVGNFGG